jgi:uncharacterized protein (TIGR02466 family)
MKTELLFPTPIWIDEKCGVEKQPLLEFVNYVRTEDPKGRRATNVGGWQSNDFIDDVMLNNPLKDLRNKILQNAYYAADQWGFQYYSLKVLNLWININKSGDSNLLHTHAGSIMSGVYYLNVPPCCSGSITFMQRFDEGCMKESWGCAANFNRSDPMNRIDHDIYPDEDSMILFPAWLPHSVSASASEDERISLSFNIVAFSDHYHEIYPSR